MTYCCQGCRLPHVLISSVASFIELNMLSNNHTHEVIDASDDFSLDPDTLNAHPFMPYGGITKWSPI